MADTLVLLWRQYRFERHLFWRNPSAAFFNFLLPLIFLALFGAIVNGKRSELDVIVPGIAGMSVMATTFTALARGERLDGLSVTRPSLEEIYLELTADG